MLAIFMTFGVFIFHMGSSKSHSMSTEIIGLVYGLISLLSDYFTSSYQEKIRKKRISFSDMVLASNVCCLVYTVIFGMMKGEFAESIPFMLEHPLAFFDIIESSLMKMFGVYFIFYHIHIFGSVSLAYITTVRKVFTVLLSFWLFNHTLGVLRIIGMGIVFTIIFIDLYDSVMKNKKKEQLRKEEEERANKKKTD